MQDKAPEIDDDFVSGLRRDLALAVKRVCPAGLATDREDIVQTALVRLVSLAQAEGDERLSTSFVRKVAINATIDAIRRHRRRPEVRLRDGRVHEILQPSIGPEQHVISQELGRTIRVALQRLGADRRAAVTLHLRGHSVPDAARRLGWSSKRVANLTYRGLRDLRRRLAAHGFDYVTRSKIAAPSHMSPQGLTFVNRSSALEDLAPTFNVRDAGSDLDGAAELHA